MSVALRSLKGQEKREAIKRRLKQPEGQRGLGYWGAIDSTKHKGEAS